VELSVKHHDFFTTHSAVKHNYLINYFILFILFFFTIILFYLIPSVGTSN